MIKAENIFWIKNNKKILKNISLEIKRGESLGLVGPNGSGKSSLLKILSLLEPPTKGTVYFQGQQMPMKAPLDIRRKIAIVFQEPLLLNMNVYQNVAVGLKLRKVSKNEIRTRVEYWLEAFGISHLAKQHAYTLSGGEAQRASLARAFALNPEILFLDEPFSSLDAPTIRDLIVDLRKVFQTTKVTTVIVSHNFRDIDALTDKMIVLLNGELKASGLKEEILSQANNPELEDFLGQLALT
ncbi:MAG: energy-coupling factor ABC transporter ATP-binding protein [Desulfitobacteriia bacterium]|jgi:tungstate transport system ATP-binding protein